MTQRNSKADSGSSYCFVAYEDQAKRSMTELRDASESEQPEEMTADERQAAAEMVSRLHSAIHPFCVNVRICDVVNDIGYDRSAGSGILLRLPSGLYLATAWHVYADLEARRNAGNEAYLIAGNRLLEAPQVAFKDATDGGDAVILRLPDDQHDGYDAVPYSLSR